jgi:type II secretory pathway pseudopilin PulG
MTQRRAGFTLIESCAAAALLVGSISLAVALLTSVARQRQSTELHARAVLAAESILERITAEPYDAITDERAAEVCEQLKLNEQLPHGAANVSISAESGSPAGKKIGVEIVWQSAASSAQARHQVVTWVYGGEGKK